MGFYSDALALVVREVLEMVMNNGSTDIVPDPEPLEPLLPYLKEKNPGDSMDDILLRAMFAGTQVDEMRRAIKTGQPGEPVLPVLNLLKSLAATKDQGKISLKVDGFEVCIDKGEG